MGYLIVLVALFALMWLLLIRPQRRRTAEQAQMQDHLRVDDEILTAGGIHGTVKAIEDEIVYVEIAPGTTIRLDRRAIAAISQESDSMEEIEPNAGEQPVSSNES